MASLMMSSDEENDQAHLTSKNSKQPKKVFSQSEDVRMNNDEDFEDEEDPIAPMDTEDMKNLERYVIL